MMTVSEAMQRMRVNNMQMHRRDGEYRVTSNELSGQDAERSAYYTDDLEDAVLTAGAMRHAKRVRP